MAANGKPAGGLDNEHSALPLELNEDRQSMSTKPASPIKTKPNPLHSDGSQIEEDAEGTIQKATGGPGSPGFKSPTSDVFESAGSDAPTKKGEAEIAAKKASNLDVSHDTGNHVESDQDPPPDKRAKDVAEKFADLNAFFVLMKERVALLETRLNEASSKASEKPAVLEPTKRVPAIPLLKRVRHAQFKNKVKDERPYAIEALVGEVKYYYQRVGEQSSAARLAEYNDMNGLGEPGLNVQASQGLIQQRESVSRIRINSAPIISILAQMRDHNWSIEPCVFLHPFKLLIRFYDQIMAKMGRLEEDWGAKARASPAATQQADPRSLDHLQKYDEELANTRKDQPAKATESSTGVEDDTKDKEAEAEAEDMTNSLEAYRDFRCLVQFMNQEIAPVLKNVNDPKQRRIEFKNLWHLFKPGCDVFIPLARVGGSKDKATTDGSTPSPPGTTGPERNSLSRYQEHWRVRSFGSGRHNLSADDSDEDVPIQEQKSNAFRLCCYYIDFDGSKFEPVHHIFRIKPYDGEREITSLEVYPSRFMHDAVEVRAKLQKRGEKFRQFSTFQHRNYRGSTLPCHPCGCRMIAADSPKSPEHIDSAVVVDFSEAIGDDDNWMPDRTWITYIDEPREIRDDVFVSIWKDKALKELDEKIQDIVSDDYVSDAEITQQYEADHPLLRNDPDPAFTEGSGLRDEELMLLPTRVLAFVFRNRKFAALDIDQIKPARKFKGGWNDLKLPLGHKEMLKSLVQTHLYEKQFKPVNDRENRDFDLVRGKGQGLVILLHGVPGVGKTSTAECVAESNGKPLFPITCGDLGLTAESVERELEEKFHLAQAWDCVLLLDEADVFLAERTRDDITRNSLVSVFLRVLEYYRGILFLTTNRVGAFDDAFKSRIHLPLYFPNLDEKQTLSIWKSNLKRTLKRKQGLMHADEKEILSFAKSHFQYGKENNTTWNGRQIRNAFQTAAALADYEAQGLYMKQTGSDKPKPVPSTLLTRHFNVVADASVHFDRYIDSIEDTTLGDRANQRNDRIDTMDVVRTDIHEDKPYGVFTPSLVRKSQQSQPMQHTQPIPFRGDKKADSKKQRPQQAPAPQYPASNENMPDYMSARGPYHNQTYYQQAPPPQFQPWPPQQPQMMQQPAGQSFQPQAQPQLQPQQPQPSQQSSGRTRKSKRSQQPTPVLPAAAPNPQYLGGQNAYPTPESSAPLSANQSGMDDPFFAKYRPAGMSDPSPNNGPPLQQAPNTFAASGQDDGSGSASSSGSDSDNSGQDDEDEDA